MGTLLDSKMKKKNIAFLRPNTTNGSNRKILRPKSVPILMKRMCVQKNQRIQKVLSKEELKKRVRIEVQSWISSCVERKNEQIRRIYSTKNNNQNKLNFNHPITLIRVSDLFNASQQKLLQRGQTIRSIISSNNNKHK